jgi:hypothetical protein
VLDIDRDAALAAIDRQEERGLAVDQVRRDCTRHIALERLDLDHVCPKLSEKLTCEGAGQDPTEVENSSALRHVIAPQCERSDSSVRI